MAAFNVGTMAELIALDGIQTGDVITLTADIDAVAQGYDDFVTLSSAYDVDLNGHTLSNVFVSGSGFFGSSRLISNGSCLNIYLDGAATCTLDKVILSMYTTTSANVAMTKSAADITFRSSSVMTNFNKGNLVLSNIVIRNAIVKQSSLGNSISIGGSGNRFSAIVFEGCTFAPYNDSVTTSTMILNGDHCYVAEKDCTFECDVLAKKGSSTSSNLFSGDFTLDTTSTAATIITETQLKDREYLEGLGFLP